MSLPYITWQDALQMPEDGRRHEAIDGELYGTPAPSTRHQLVSGCLLTALGHVLDKPGYGETFITMTAVEFPETREGVMPDLMFVSNERRGIITEDWLVGAPDLVIEITSPVTEDRDRGIKLDLYRRQGVREYWIVNPDEDVVDVWRFGEEPEEERFKTELPVRLGADQVGTIDLDVVFSRDLFRSHESVARRSGTRCSVEGRMMKPAIIGSDLETTPARSYDVPTMEIPSITWQDVQQIPDDGNRYEAIEGSSYMTPAPTFRHQRVGHRLGKALDEVLEQPGHGVVVPAPFGVEFPATGEGVQPDLLFVSNERRGLIANAGLTGAPDLVVEILSPSTASRDRGLKLRLYERQGVREYWIVDSDKNTVDVWRFGEDPAHERFTNTLPVRLGTEEVGSIDLEAVFAPDL
ncbi:MAG: Uma2 family endonuclease [Acidimicrobiales bacterium]|nr:Uma2 family endonuclease [Acidimicrobiales bacterium]